MRKIKEAGINSSFQNNSIRLADSARPALGPVYPDIRMNALLAFLVSTLLAAGAVIMADLLDNTVCDPEQIKRGIQDRRGRSAARGEELAWPRVDAGNEWHWEGTGENREARTTDGV